MEVVMSTSSSTVPAVTSSATSPVRINPTTWNEPFGFDQAQLRRAPKWVLTVAGQGPVDGDGQLVHEGDVAAQVARRWRTSSSSWRPRAWTSVMCSA
jgi:hypothetical protein